MGTPEFAVPALEALIKNKSNVVSVYTQSPKKSQRGQKIKVSPIQLFSEKNNLQIKNPENLNNQEEYKNFHNLSADLGIVVAYGKLIPKNFLNLTKFGFINIHASLLPRWRGAAPIQRAILNGDKKTGVSIMKIEEKLDCGPVLNTKELILDENSTYGETEKKLSKLGAALLIESLKKIESGKAKFSEQTHSKATYANKINKSESKINWSNNADKIIAHVHGLSPRPGAWFKYKNERFKVLRAKKSTLNGKPGEILDEKLTIACQQDSIEISEIQREGKKRQATKDFLLGSKMGKGTVLS